MDFTKLTKLINLNLWYLPILVLVVLVLSFAVVGCVKGGRRILYGVPGNILGLVIGFFIAQVVGGKVFYPKVQPSLVEGEGKTLGEQNIVNTLNSLKGIIVMVVIIVTLVVFNLVALALRLIFRKKLNNLFNVKSPLTIKGRISGSMLGVVSALPLTAMLAGSSTLVSRNEGVNNNISRLSLGLSFGEVDNVSDNLLTIYAADGSAAAIPQLHYLFVGATVSDYHEIIEAKDCLKIMFDHDRALLGYDNMAHMSDYYKGLNAPIGNPDGTKTLGRLTRSRLDAIEKLSGYKDILDLTPRGAENMAKIIETKYVDPNALNQHELAVELVQYIATIGGK